MLSRKCLVRHSVIDVEIGSQGLANLPFGIDYYRVIVNLHLEEFMWWMCKYWACVVKELGFGTLVNGKTWIPKCYAIFLRNMQCMWRIRSWFTLKLKTSYAIFPSNWQQLCMINEWYHKYHDKVVARDRNTFLELYLL